MCKELCGPRSFVPLVAKPSCAVYKPDGASSQTTTWPSSADKGNSLIGKIQQRYGIAKEALAESSLLPIKTEAGNGDNCLGGEVQTV